MIYLQVAANLSSRPHISLFTMFEHGPLRPISDAKKADLMTMVPRLLLKADKDFIIDWPSDSSVAEDLEIDQGDEHEDEF